MMFPLPCLLVLSLSVLLSEVYNRILHELEGGSEGGKVAESCGYNPAGSFWTFF